MEPNRCRERERAKLRKMMYMWGKQRVEEVGGNKEGSKARIKSKDKKIGSRRIKISTTAKRKLQW